MGKRSPGGEGVFGKGIGAVLAVLAVPPDADAMRIRLYGLRNLFYGILGAALFMGIVILLGNFGLQVGKGGNANIFGVVLFPLFIFNPLALYGGIYQIIRGKSFRQGDESDSLLDTTRMFWLTPCVAVVAFLVWGVAARLAVDRAVQASRTEQDAWSEEVRRGAIQFTSGNVARLRSGGVAGWNAWVMQPMPSRETSLIQADLRGMRLAGINLHGIDLKEANCTGTDFEKANFRMAHLEMANFTDANLAEADFLSARLEGAVFHNANLANARFEATCKDQLKSQGARNFASIKWY